MRRILILAAVALALGGCSEYIARGIDFLSRSLTAVKAEIQSACAQVGAAETAAETAIVSVGAACSKWHQKAVQVRSGIAAICTNVNLLDDKIAGNYVVSVRAQLQSLKAAKPDGC